VREWTWCTGEWSKLPEALEMLEAEGWTIFTVLNEGESGRYVRIVYYRQHGGMNDQGSLR